MSGIIKCLKCGENMLINKKVIEEGEHKGEHLVSCIKCGYKIYIKY
jgi:DNA-directed RNA polymerase subunit RPC12/RpoP